VLPQGFNYMLADRAKAMTIGQWQQLGLGAPPAASPSRSPADKAYLLAPRRRRGAGLPDAAEFSGDHEIQPG